MLNIDSKDSINVDESQSFIDDLIDKLYQRQSTEGIDFGELIEDLKGLKKKIKTGAGDDEKSGWKKDVKDISWDILRIAIIKAVSEKLPVVVEKISHLI